MRFYFAPMEGVTGYIYRNAHHEYFPGVEKYFTPFIQTKQDASFKSREWNDILLENNQGIPLVPQILSNNAADFLATAEQIRQLGYDEVNLNLGCPSGTVVAKYKGSGFLTQKEELNTFLSEVFSKTTGKISIKTRLGKDSPEEFYELMDIFNRYPIEELIIHARIQQDFYKNQPNWEMFQYGLEHSKNPICYNGDIFGKTEYEKLIKEFPDIESVMLGRGLIKNPGLVQEIKNGTKLDKSKVRQFHDRILSEYQKILFGDKNILYKMKEIWLYMLPLFANHEKYAKKLKKADRLSEYQVIVNALFSEDIL